MKTKQYLTIGLALLLVVGFSVGTAIARGPSNVYATIHNLSTSGPALNPANPAFNGFNLTYAEGVEDRICVFCHTPHGGQLNTPLWNRDISGLQLKTYSHYDSVTLSSVVNNGDSNRTVNNESLLCLSCHDGSIAVGDLVNASNGTPDTATAFISAFDTDPGPVIGAVLGNSSLTNELSDDHPISFSYSAVQALKPTEFVDAVSVDPDLRLYGAADRLECGTCHDPHVDYTANPEYTPFLAMPNAGSALCLACHIK